MAKFEYRGRDRNVEDVVRRSKQSGGGYDSYLVPDIAFYKPREGENAVRIMPPTWKDTKKWGDNWEIQVWLHRNVGPDNGTYLCLDKMLGKPCPVCAARRSAADEDEADALRPQWRALAWVIDRDAEKAGPQVWGQPVTLFREINLRSVDKKTDQLVLIDDPEEGFDLLFTKEGTGKKTKYLSIEVDRQSTPLHDNENKQEDWLDYVAENPLPEILQYYDAEHIEKVLFGAVRRPDADDEGDARSTRTRRARSNGAEPPEEEDSGRGRRRAREEPEEEQTSTRRGRGRSEPEDGGEQEESSSRRGRGRSESEEDERPSGRRGRTDPEPETNTRRGRSESEDEGDNGSDEEEAPPTRRTRREEPEEEQTSARRRRAAPDPEPEPETRRGGRGGRSGGDEEPEQQARRQLNRLRDRASK